MVDTGTLVNVATGKSTPLDSYKLEKNLMAAYSALGYGPGLAAGRASWAKTALSEASGTKRVEALKSLSEELSLQITPEQYQ